MQGVKSTLAALNRLSDAIESGVPEALDRELSQRVTFAQGGYDTAKYDGNNDVTVRFERNGDEWNIIAEGSALLFIEYGTGIMWPHTNPIEDDRNAATSWSATHSQYLTSPEKLAKYHGWWRLPLGEGSSTIFVNGNPSANVMYDTSKQVSERVPNVIIQALRRFGK